MNFPLDEIAGNLHAGQRFDAARLVLRASGVKKEPKTEADALEPLNILLYWLLNEDRYSDAAKLLWVPSLFDCRPRCVQIIWEALRDKAFVLLQGSGSVGKTYSAGVFFLLDWLRDPLFTTVKVVGPSESHLAANLFSHLVNLHTSASLPLPGYILDLFIGTNKRNKRGGIEGTIIPLGPKGAGRLQGVKRFRRKSPHAKFGILSRTRVLLDELEKIAPGVWQDIGNLMTTYDGDGGLKIVGAYNPEIVGGPTYSAAEPPDGWQAFDMEKDEVWDSKRGWRVVRIDAEKTENVVSGKTIYPGFQTKDGIERLAQQCGGRDSPGYYTFGRGCYPTQGTAVSIIPGSFLQDFKARLLWLETPKLCAAVDSALEGADAAVMAVGNFGVATGMELPPTPAHPKGRTIMFDTNGRSTPRYMLSVDQLITLEPGDTIKMASQIKKVAQQLALDPNWLMLDRTGNGQGVFDALRELWSPEVRAVNYSESSTHTKILQEDTEFADDLYERIDAELWYALRRWLEASAVKGSLSLDKEKLFDQLTSRQTLIRAGRLKKYIETKPDFKHRSGGKSCNEADAVCLLLHCVRMASGISPSVLPSMRPVATENWDTSEAIVSVANRFEDLDTPDLDAWMPSSQREYLEMD